MKSGVRQSSVSQGRSTSTAQDPGPGLVCRPRRLRRPARPARRRAPRGHVRFCVPVGTAPPQEGQTHPCWCCLLAAFSKVPPKEPGQVKWQSCDGPIALGWECASDITVRAGPCEPLCKRQTFCVSATQPDAPSGLRSEVGGETLRQMQKAGAQQGKARPGRTGDLSGSGPTPAPRSQPGSLCI